MVKKYNGFSSVEILLVVAIIVMLVALTYISLNPSKRQGDVNNALRKGDLLIISGAFSDYIKTEGNKIDNLGVIATCPSTTKIGTVSEGIDLGKSLVPTFAVAIPSDPLSLNTADSGYTVCSNANGKFQFNAPLSENGKVVSVIK
jgi:type II secretory pathway pseudopilin PulG